MPSRFFRSMSDSRAVSPMGRMRRIEDLLVTLVNLQLVGSTLRCLTMGKKAVPTIQNKLDDLQREVSGWELESIIEVAAHCALYDSICGSAF